MWQLYNNTDIPLAKHQLPPDNMPGIAWKQDGFYNATNGDVFLPHITKPLDLRVQKLMRRAYYSAVTWMDEQVGRVMDEMEALDLVSSTVVLLHGDHGWQLGEHNSWHKFTNFELGTRIPLIVRAPWKTASIGKRVNMMVELIDVYPTVNQRSTFAHTWVFHSRFFAHASPFFCTRFSFSVYAFLADRRSGNDPPAL
jgi:iduronate 2-sulfatase